MSRADVVAVTDVCGDVLAEFAVVVDPLTLSLQRHAVLERDGVAV